MAADLATTPIVVGTGATLTPAGRRRILALKLDHLGDFIIGLPAMRAMRELFTDDHITLICGSWNLSQARAARVADEVVAYDYFDSIGWQGQPVQDPAVFETAVEGGFDIAIDLRVDADTRHLLERVQATLKCGIGSRAQFPFLDIVLPVQTKFRDEPMDGDRWAISPGRFVSRLSRAAGMIHQSPGSIANGHVVFGPYVKLPPGRFRVTFVVSAQGALLWPTAKLTVEVARDQVMLTSACVQPAELKGESIGPCLIFDNDHEDEQNENTGKFEFRVHKSGWAPFGALQFAGVRLERVDAIKSISRQRPMELHIGEQLSLLVELIRQRIALRPPETPLAPARRAEIASQVAALPPGPRIMLSPLSNKTLRDWPLESYVRLTGLLLSRPDTQIVLLGSEDQGSVLDEIARRNGGDERIINLAGKTTWAELSEVVAQADLVICNNSGVAHLAAVQGLPTLAIYSGAVQPQEWGPRGLHVRTLMAQVSCSPCGWDRLEECPHNYLCMKLVTPEIVLEHALAMLEDSFAANEATDAIRLPPTKKEILKGADPA